jgi:hypothetical protein
VNREQVELCTIYKVIHGSHAYGLNTPESDIDIRGICIPPEDYYLRPDMKFEQYDPLGEELVICGITKYFQLAMNCNPNVIEILFIDNPKHILVETEWSRILKSQRNNFLSMKAKFTFSGYAVAQLKRIETHRKWLLHPPDHRPTRSEFGLPEINPISSSNLGATNKLIDAGYQLDKNVMRLVQLENEFQDALETYKNYERWKKERNPKRAALEAQFGFDCYSIDTEFLTEDGWMNFDDISDNMKVATINPKTHQLEYQKPVARFDAKYTGNMYNFVGYHTDINVTANHRMYVNLTEKNTGKSHGWQLKEAALLPNNYGILNVITPRVRQFKNEHPLGLDLQLYMQLMGMYLSEGCISKRRNDGSASVISISQLKGGRIHWKMSRLRNDYPDIKINEYCHYRRSLNRYEMTWTIPNRELATQFDIECGNGCKVKHIPRWVFNCSRRIMTILLDTMIAGDGTIRKKQKTIIYYTSSKQLANDVQELAFHCGYETSLYGPYKNVAQNGTTCDIYQIHINKTPRKIRILDRRNIHIEPVVNQRIVCFSVPNSILITRRNGHVAIQGNCKHASHLVRLMRVGYEILTQGQLIVERPDAEELKAIKNGKWSYDEVISYAKDMDKTLDYLYQHPELCAVPLNVNREELSLLCADIIKNYWNSKEYI